MGQSINVQSRAVDAFCIFTTDRVLTGQDGARFVSAEEAAADEGFLAKLASELFAADEAVENVYVASSEVVVGRASNWDDDTIAAAERIITDLYRFYEPS